MEIFDLNCSKLKAPVSIPSIIISPSISAILNKDPIKDDFPACTKINIFIRNLLLLILDLLTYPCSSNNTNFISRVNCKCNSLQCRFYFLGITINYIFEFNFSLSWPILISNFLYFLLLWFYMVKN